MTSRKLQTGIAVAVGLLVVTLFFLYGNVITSIGMDTSSQLGAAGAQPEQLVVQDERIGTGATAEVGKSVTVNYTGRFADGRVFDTSIGREPFTFTLGAGSVIAGWDQGLQGMQVGGKRLLIVPPSLGYGAMDYGPIPGNSTLIFEVELLSVQ
ncbi:FKBP-type peptidyl-prolyl cis-trans isomerase [Candidatus Nomurabacteria bacterium]|nr:FKBP-type peptidyl-prolyl cis-trans isomerase [Candidatus Nomurabacteria bacterium]